MVDEKKRHTSGECFLAAIQELRKTFLLRGTQKDMAARIGYTESHLSQVFKGKREPGIALQEALAGEFGFALEDVLRIGRGILEGQGFVPFLGKIEHLPANSEEQAHEIVSLTNQQFGIDGFLSGYRPAGWSEFLEGKTTPGEFYSAYSTELKRLIAVLSKKSNAHANASTPDKSEKQNP